MDEGRFLRGPGGPGRRGWLVGFALALLGAVALPVPAAALSCVGPVEAARNAELAVLGTVIAKPGRGTVLLAVERFYRGTGENPIAIDISEIGPDSMWITEEPRVGDRILAGLRRRDADWHLPICQVYAVLPPGMAIPESLAAELGEGVPPSMQVGFPAVAEGAVPEGVMPSPPPVGVPAAESSVNGCGGYRGAAVLVSLSGLGVWALIRRRRCRQEP